jgi:hypothetical protein
VKIFTIRFKEPTHPTPEKSRELISYFKIGLAGVESTAWLRCGVAWNRRKMGTDGMDEMDGIDEMDGMDEMDGRDERGENWRMVMDGEEMDNGEFQVGSKDGKGNCTMKELGLVQRHCIIYTIAPSTGSSSLQRGVERVQGPPMQQLGMPSW